MTDRCMLAFYHIKPLAVSEKRFFIQNFLFFFFSISRSRKKEYIRTERAKVAENQQVKGAHFWDFKVCNFVRTVQKYGAQKSCKKCTIYNVLIHNEIRYYIGGGRTNVQFFPITQAPPAIEIKM